MSPPRRGRRQVAPAPVVVAVAAAILSAQLWAPPARAQAGAGPGLAGSFEVRYAASVGWSSQPGPAPSGPIAGEPDASLLVAAHADLTARWTPVSVTLRLDPAMTAAGAAAPPDWEPGLTEAFALLREGPVDASVGLERLTLETARLTVPFQVDPVAADGTRRGVWGARVSAYTGPWRLRAAGFLVPPELPGSAGGARGRVGGAASARLDLTVAQIELDALYLDAPVLGAGASGTVGGTVVYGEAWLLADPWRGRGALGASGYLGDALGGAMRDTLWTLEAAFAPPPGAPGLPPMAQLAGRLDVPLANGDTLHATGDLGLSESTLAPGTRRLEGSAALLWEPSTAQTSFQLGPSLSSGELGTRLALQVRLTASTGF